MRRLQGRGVPLLCPPQGDKGHSCQVPCLQGRLSLERLHCLGRAPGDYGQDARPSFERRPSCQHEVLCQGPWSLQGRRGQTWCVPLPAEQVPVQQRRPQQTDHSQMKGCVSLAKPWAFVASAYNQRRFNKTWLVDYIFVGYCFSLFYQSVLCTFMLGTRTKSGGFGAPSSIPLWEALLKFWVSNLMEIIWNGRQTNPKATNQSNDNKATITATMFVPLASRFFWMKTSPLCSSGKSNSSQDSSLGRPLQGHVCCTHDYSELR